MEVSDSQLSIVIQGPVRSTRNGINLTALSVESVRRLLPNAEVIFSSWHNVDTTSLNVDRIVVSHDPGPLTRHYTRDCNVNRQIISTAAGIQSAKRPYCVKLRSDCVLLHTGFLSLLPPSPSIGPKILTYPIVSSSVYFKNPKRAPFLFHPGDLFHFGLTADLSKIWSIPLASKDEITNWINYQRKPLVSFTGQSFFRYIEEQYIWISCLKKYGHEVDIRFPWDMNPELIEISERSIFQNFSIYNNDILGLWIPWATLFFGVNKIYNQTEISDLSEIYRTNDRKKIKRRQYEVILNHTIRTPLQFFAGKLNRYGVF